MAVRTNILSFDGGGTRGQTSLIILKAIMNEINSTIDIPGVTLTPQDIFHAVSGTSTGGLIAIMLGRFGMSVDQCIEQYDSMALRIFSKRKLLGYLSKGILNDRYSSKPLRACVGQLAAAHDGNKDALMRSEKANGRIPCTVLACRMEFSGEADSSATFICSHVCHPDRGALISDAAHATTAAPFFFRECVLAGQLYIDGGFGHNNPTYSTYSHYSDLALQESPLKARGIRSEAIRVVSIGTGRPSEAQLRAEEQLQRSRSLKTRLKRHYGLAKSIIDEKTSVDNQNALIQMIGPDKLAYLRIDGAEGVKQFRLDACDADSMRKMRHLTEAWLQQEDGQRQISTIAQMLAADWRSRQAVPGQQDQSSGSSNLRNPASPDRPPQTHDTSLRRPSLSIPQPSTTGSSPNVSAGPMPSTPGLTQGETHDGRTESLQSVDNGSFPRRHNDVTTKPGTISQPSAVESESESLIGQQFTEPRDLIGPVLQEVDHLSI